MIVRKTFKTVKEKLEITNSICKTNLVIRSWNGYTHVMTGKGNMIFDGTNREVYDFLNGLENVFLKELADY